MGRCWMFEEIDEYSPLALKIISHDFRTIKSIEKEKLKLTEYQSNPLEPIREVWEQIKGYKIEGCDEPFSHSIANQMWRAIQESVRRMEEGE